MVWFQTWDFFSEDFILYGSITEIGCLGFDFFNWMPIFMTVYGVSLFLSLKKKLTMGYSKFKILASGFRRYGGYIF